MRKKSVCHPISSPCSQRFDEPPPQTAGATIKQLPTHVRSKFFSAKE
jgi:hypothetical protein